MNNKLFKCHENALSLLFGHGQIAEKDGKKGVEMRKVIVKKRKIEREFGNLKLVFLVYDVCELVKNEDGTTVEISVRQVYDVRDIWDFEDVNDIYEEA
jgi:hypothetical protein